MLSMHHAFDPLRMASRPVEAEHRAPILHHQRDLIAELELLEPSIEIAGVVSEPVTAARITARLTHSDQIGREASRQRATYGIILRQR